LTSTAGLNTLLGDVHWADAVACKRGTEVGLLASEEFPLVIYHKLENQTSTITVKVRRFKQNAQAIQAALPGQIAVASAEAKAAKERLQARLVLLGK
jgi:hypothetical protein